MKINLLNRNPGEIRSGYLNIDPHAEEHDDPYGRSKCELECLDLLVDANECEEIVAHDVIDLYPTDKVDDVLANWLSKLAHNGKIAISCLDIREVSRKYMAGTLSIDEVNQLLYANGNQCCLTLPQLVEVLETAGLKILTARNERNRAVVTAERK